MKKGEVVRHPILKILSDIVEIEGMTFNQHENQDRLLRLDWEILEKDIKKRLGL